MCLQLGYLPQSAQFEAEKPEIIPNEDLSEALVVVEFRVPSRDSNRRRWILISLPKMAILYDLGCGGASRPGRVTVRGNPVAWIGF